MAFVSAPLTTSQTRANSGPSTCKSTFLGVRAASRCSLALTHIFVTRAVSTNDFKNGTTILMDGTVYRVQEFLHVKPGKGSAFVRSKLKNMKTGNTVEKTFKAGEQVQDAVLEKAEMQHTYMDGADFVFMNMETYEEERFDAAALGDRVVKYMTEGLVVEVLKHNADIIGVELPKSMVLTVTQTDPGVKGNTVQGGTKPATLESGAEVMVPLFINEGEKIVVNTEENKYVSRFNE